MEYGNEFKNHFMWMFIKITGTILFFVVNLRSFKAVNFQSIKPEVSYAKRYLLDRGLYCHFT